jgi:hypothetical protein
MTTEFDDEVLVAYLDGELDPERTQEIEVSIAQQPALQERISKLRMAWDMLEDLPVVKPSEHFAASTMEMIALAVDDKPESWKGWISKYSSLIVLLSIPSLFLVGFMWGKYGQSRAERHLLRDLPMLVDWKSLSNIDSIAWLEILAAEPQLTEATQGEPFSIVGGGSVPPTYNERREWLAKLSDADRSRLSSNRNELQQRDLVRQNDLRAITAHIYADSKKTPHYLAAIRAYETLLQDQSLTLRASLNDMSLEQRQVELTHLVSWRLAEIYGRTLLKNDAVAIHEWADDMQIKYIDSIVAYPEGALTSVYYNWFIPNSVIVIDDFDNLQDRLSSRAQTILKGLTDSESRMRALMIWISSLAFPRTNNGDTVPTERLKELYSKLPSTQQDAVDLLPPEEAQRKIRQLANAPLQMKEGIQPAPPRREP